jgi:hypothetical protein
VGQGTPTFPDLDDRPRDRFPCIRTNIPFNQEGNASPASRLGDEEMPVVSLPPDTDKQGLRPHAARIVLDRCDLLIKAPLK